MSIAEGEAQGNALCGCRPGTAMRVVGEVGRAGMVVEGTGKVVSGGKPAKVVSIRLYSPLLFRVFRRQNSRNQLTLAITGIALT